MVAQRDDTRTNGQNTSPENAVQLRDLIALMENERESHSNRMSALLNALKPTDYIVEDVLVSYIESQSEHYFEVPGYVRTDVDKWCSAAKEHGYDFLTEQLCEQAKPDNRVEALNRAVTIYQSQSLSGDEQKDRLDTFLATAGEHNIDIGMSEVLTAAKHGDAAERREIPSKLPVESDKDTVSPDSDTTECSSPAGSDRQGAGGGSQKADDPLTEPETRDSETGADEIGEEIPSDDTQVAEENAEAHNAGDSDELPGDLDLIPNDDSDDPENTSGAGASSTSEKTKDIPATDQLSGEDGTDEDGAADTHTDKKATSQSATPETVDSPSEKESLGDKAASTDTEPADPSSSKAEESVREPTPQSTPVGQEDNSEDELGQPHPGQVECPEEYRSELQESVNTSTTPRQPSQVDEYLNTTELVGFEYVIGDEEVGITGATPDGIMKLEDGRFAGIARIQPRSWRIHTPKRQRMIYALFQAAFLANIKYHTQIVEYPIDLDMDSHIKKIREGGADGEETDILRYGRKMQANWLNAFCEENEVQDRLFAIVTEVSREDILRESDLMEKIHNLPMGDTLTELLPSSNTTVSDAKCVQVIRNRLQELKKASERNGLDISVEPITDREVTLRILHYYYNDNMPEVSQFSGTPAPYSVGASPDTPIDPEAQEGDR
jgi:hypothetical protein